MSNRRSIPRTPQEILDLYTFPEPMSGCWLWGGAVQPQNDPYGLVTVTVGPPQWVDGKYKRSVKHYAAHRVSYELNVGPIPEGLVLDHLCRVRLCVNPDHLEPVTQKENVARSLPYRNRKRKTHCPQGHPYLFRANGDSHCPPCMRAKFKRWYERKMAAKSAALE